MFRFDPGGVFPTPMGCRIGGIISRLGAAPWFEKGASGIVRELLPSYYYIYFGHALSIVGAVFGGFGKTSRLQYEGKKSAPGIPIGRECVRSR